MQNVLQSGKRALSVAVAAATMLFSVGAGLLQPSVAAAATAGDLIKGTSLSTVYYYGYDGMRYTFPNEKTYKTWYSDFSGVSTISDSALADLSLAGNVVYRPGSYWVKVQSDDKVYAVSTDGSIHWIESEDVAVDYAGSTWNTRIQDVPDVFFTDYSVGSSLMTATAFDGMLYMDGGNYYVALNGEKRMVSSAGRSANGLQAGFFLSGSGIDDGSLSSGSDVTSAMTSLMDAAQTEEGDAVTGGVSISLASSTPAASTIPDAASGVKVATFKMTADDAATINVMNVALMGLAATADIASSGVYLYEGSTRLTDGKSFNSSTRKAVFGSVGLDFAAGETRYVSVVVDMGNNNSTTNFSVGLESADDVEASGSVSGSFPISGNTMSIVNSAVGGVTIDNTGSLSNPVVGANDATISKFKLTASSTEDISLQRITLKIDDSGDHSGFQLWQSGTWLADGEYIGNKLVLFDLGTAFTIAKGANRTFDVTADIGGKAAETITTHLNNGADLYAVGATYGFGVTVTDGDFDTAAEGSSVTIQGGELSISFSGPSATDVSSTAADFSLFEGTMTAERSMTITAMSLNLAMTENDSANDSTFEETPLSDLRLVNADTGALLAGPIDLCASAACADGDVADVLAFTDDFVLGAGESINFALTADVETTADASDAYTATLDVSTITAEDDSGDAITDIVPTTDLAGNAQTIVTSGLTITLASTPTGISTRSYVRGTTDVNFVSFNFAAASGGDIEVTDFSPVVVVNENSYDTDFAAGREDDEDASPDSTYVNATDNITSCSLYDGTTLIAGPESIASATTGVVNFTGFSYTVSAGMTSTLSVHCNLANVAQGGSSSTNQYAIEIPAGTSVTALDSEGDAATVTATTINFSSSTPTVGITMRNSGALAVTAASDAPSADILLTGSTGNSVAKFRFDATYEAFVVNRLRVEEQQAATDTGTANSTAYANNVSLVTVSYPDSTGTTQTASGALTSNGVTFNDLTFYVAKDGHAEVTVKVDVASTDRSGGSATSNERIRMVLDDGTGELRAVGQGSGQTLSDSSVTNVDTAGSSMNKFVIRETRPTITLSSSSPSGSGKNPGNQEALRLNIAAASGEDVVLKNIIFTMSASDNASTDWDQCDTDVADGTMLYASGADFTFFNLTEDSAAASALAGTYSLLKSTGAPCDATNTDVAFVKLALTTAEVIPAGTTQVFSLWFNSDSASSINDDSVQFGVASDPLTSTYLALGTPRTVSGAHTISVTTLTGSGALDTTSSSAVAVGDILAAAGTERMLVTAYTGGASAATVVRGYLGTTPAALSGGEAITRMPGALLWQDDGSTAVSSSTQEYYGAHLVKSLPITGYGYSF